MKVDTKKSPLSQSLVGTLHRFGKNGVLYQVLREVDGTSALIRVLETGEETTYPIADIKDDPNE